MFIAVLLPPKSLYVHALTKSEMISGQQKNICYSLIRVAKKTHNPLLSKNRVNMKDYEAPTPLRVAVSQCQDTEGNVSGHATWMGTRLN